jgi:YHS domain-containing protein
MINKNLSEYSIIKKSLLTKDISVLKYKEIDYLKDNKELELDDIISKIYYNYNRYLRERNTLVEPYLILEEFISKDGGFMESKYIWSSLYLGNKYYFSNTKEYKFNNFPKNIFGGVVNNPEEMLDVFIKIKNENPYSFVLSNKGFEIIANCIVDYINAKEIFSLSSSVLKNKLNKLKPVDYFPADTYKNDDSMLFEYYELNNLIEKHLNSVIL